MPISRDEFDAGEQSLETALMAFFRQNELLAFTSDEADSELEILGFIWEAHRVEQVLQALTEQGRVESKRICGRVYYSYHRYRLGFGPR